MAESESSIQRRIQMALAKQGSLVWRNESSGSYMGKVIHKAGDQVTLSGARFLPAGLCKGSSDLICCTPTVITQDMVGKTIGVFTAVEVKTARGRTSPEQDKFLLAVNRAGGIGFVARSAEQAVELLNNAL